MFKNHLYIAFRHLFKRKGYALLNIAGLALGMACCLLIFGYVAYQRSYENYNSLAGRVVRVELDDYQNGKLALKCASNYAALGPALKKDFPEVEATCRLYKSAFLLSDVSRGLKFTENEVYYAEPAVLDLFHITLKQGDPKTALDAPFKLLISEDMAHKYFGQASAIGRTLSSKSDGGSMPLVVSGVYANIPPNSHVHMDMLVSYKTMSVRDGKTVRPNDPAEISWTWTDFFTYALLRSGVDIRSFQAKMPGLAGKYVNNRPSNKSNHDSSVFQLMPMQDIHLYSHVTEQMEANGDGTSLSFLFVIAFFILGIAWINYINLATARSLERAKEVGVRKVLGALRSSLILQFLMESLLLNLAALLLAIALLSITAPLFRQLTGLPVGAVLPFGYWQGFLALFITGSFLSGLYPAFVLSRYRPVSVLKGLFKNSAGGLLLRKGLMVGQFATSIMLIAGTIIVFRQVAYMRSQHLGANIGRTLVLNGAAAPDDSSYHGSLASFKNEMQQLPEVKGFTASSAVMGQEILWCTNWQRMQDAKQGWVTIFHLAVDYDFIPEYGLKMIAGRNFSKDFPADDKNILLNELAAKQLGFASPEQALRHWLVSADGDTAQVAGIVANFHQEGLQKPISPLVVFLRPGLRNSWSVKLSSALTAETITSVKKIWDRHFPGDPFSYFYLDDFFDRQYAEDRRFGQVFGLFATFAILIACFGLLGLSAYNVLQRTKEIGIRKVLGASVQQLLFILSKDFLVLVAISFLIAIPLTWTAMYEWLQGYAYHTTISWWIFVVAGVLALFIACVTISIQALKAALDNPVKSLRTE